MLRRIAPLALAATLVFGGPTAVRAASTEVAIEDVGEDSGAFSPRKLAIKVGGDVHWSNGGSARGHNVEQDNRSLFFSGEVTPDPIDFTVTPSAGTFHYFCENHGSKFGGMDGFVKVPVTIQKKPSGKPFTVKWATSSTDTGSVFDVQYKVGKGKWKNWKKDTSKLKGVFGKRSKPVNLKSGKKYSFRARSQEGSDRSKWSPKKSFRV